MNPEWHDEFVPLCALFFSGELTDEEWAHLQVHMAYCVRCRAAFQEYERLAEDVIPVMAASAFSELEAPTETSSFSLEAAEQRLMNQLNTAPTVETSRPHKSAIWTIAAGMIAACFVCVACLTALHFTRSKARPVTQAVSPIEVEKASRPPIPTNSGNKVQPAPDLAQSEVARLQQQLNAAEDRYRQSNSSALDIEQQLQAERGDRKRISDERDALSQQLASAQTEAQALHDKSTTDRAMVEQQAAQTTALEAKLHELNATLDEKDRMLALDKDFLGHDREIRDLIAARNLYIADIYDVAQNGKTEKTFGRVFYTKDKTLVFYGYDLDRQAGLQQLVAFQAWGAGDDRQNVSLGLFYQDGTQKRWVLRFNDAKTLSRLNKVFVTAEPPGGSAKPTGKQILMAYLQVQPNHP